MKATLFLSDRDRDNALRPVLVSGFHKCGVQVENFKDKNLNNLDTDLAVFFGVRCMRMFQECQRQGIQTLFIDKGYIDRNLYLRVALGGYQPSYFHELDYDDTRLKRIGVKIKKQLRGERKLIIYAGSSEKYAKFHDLGDVNDYASDVCDKIAAEVKGQKTILYRPKPSWWKGYYRRGEETPPVPKSATSMDMAQKLTHHLKSAHCLVTHGSNAAVEALIYGVPVIMLSDSTVNPAFPLCEAKLENIHKPYWPSDKERIKLLSNLSWCQFTYKEIETGFMWEVVGKWYNYRSKEVSNVSVSGDQL